MVSHETGLPADWALKRWVFGPGPDRWPIAVQHQPETATGSQPEGLHVVCARCGQSVTRLGNWSVTLETLKPQVAAHVMQVHEAEVIR